MSLIKKIVVLLVVTLGANAQKITVSETLSNGEAEKTVAAVVKVRDTEIKEGASLETNATLYVGIDSFFDTAEGAFFEAKIITRLPYSAPEPVSPPVQTPSEPVTPPVQTPSEPVPPPVQTPPEPITPTVPEPPNPKSECENLQNHGPASPHLVGQFSSNSLIGEVHAKYTPEYRIEGLTDWKKMSSTGLIIPGVDLYYHYFKEPSDGNDHNILLRTRAGCTEYRDVRLTNVNQNTMEGWSDIEVKSSRFDYVEIGANFFINSSDGNGKLNDLMSVFSIYSDQKLDNLRGRFVKANSIHFKDRSSQLLKYKDNNAFYESEATHPKKDFIMDVSTDNFKTGSRYMVYRNSQGGHWSIASTLTRHDGRVTVSIQGISLDVDQRLVNVNTGQVYNNVPAFGGLFELGNLSDGDYQFVLKTYHGVTINDRIIVKVKRPEKK